MDINKIITIISGLFTISKEIPTPLPTPLLLVGAKLRPGISSRQITSRIISRQLEAGAPVGALPSGVESVTEKMERIRVEEIINALQTESKVEAVLEPGVAVVSFGANAGGPVVSQGYTVTPGTVNGVIR